MAKNIVNIINFIRGIEPRCDIDLYRPVIEQKKLLKDYGFSGSFLMQYDALYDERFVSLMQEDNEDNEVGLWFEVVEPLCQAVGIPWRGRFPWDWHANVGFSVGYTPKEREKLVDEAFRKFKEVFSYYPRVMGSWIIDARTLDYANRKYGLDASCNCKDQWGTDGYTLWGAYYNGAYYPSRNNVFSTANDTYAQIPVPIFRMLGSDPVLQYDAGLDLASGAAAWQGVKTLEPVYRAGGGGDRSWVDWYFKENFNGESMAYAYTQVGQENSFGWDAMKDGLVYQFETLAKMKKKLTIETLGASGRWFKKRFVLTPATSMICHSDFENSGKQSAWYNNRRYRVNLYDDGEGVRLRDLMLFCDDYPERYLQKRETTSVLQFDTLPVIDGNRMSGNGIRAGGYLTVDGRRAGLRKMSYAKKKDDLILTLFTDIGKITAYFLEDEIVFFHEDPDKAVKLSIEYDTTKETPFVGKTAEGLRLLHNGHKYKIGCRVEKNDSQNGRLLLDGRLTML